MFGVEKPDSRFFLHALDSLGFSPEQSLHIGDDPIDDFEGAQRAGISALLLNRDGIPEERTISSLDEVLNWI